MLISNEILIAVVQDGKTALLLASHYGHSECVKLLLDRGADLTIKKNVSSIEHDSVYYKSFVFVKLHGFTWKCFLCQDGKTAREMIEPAKKQEIEVVKPPCIVYMQ